MSKNIEPKNDKDQKHGLWERYYYNDNKLWFKCLFHNDKKVGYSEWYHWNNSGKLRKKRYYI